MSKRNSRRRSRRRISKRNSKRRSRRRISKQKQDGGEVKYGDPTVGDKIRSVFRATAVPLTTVKDTADMFIGRAERVLRDNKYDMDVRFSKQLGDLKTKFTNRDKRGEAEISRARAQSKFDKCIKNIKFSDNDKKKRDRLRKQAKKDETMSVADKKLLSILEWGTIDEGPYAGEIIIHPCDKPEIADDTGAPCEDNNRCVQNPYRLKQCVSDESIKNCDKQGVVGVVRRADLLPTSAGASKNTNIKLGSEKMFT